MERKNQIKHIVESTLVPHTAFEHAIAQIEQCFDYALDSQEPICLAVIGESRTGKSRVLEECRVTHSAVRTEDGMQVPIVHVTVPSKPTVKSLAELMLEALGDPMADRGSENSKTRRIRTLMKAVGTQMVMLDEFHHFQDKGSQKIMHHVSDWLKNLVNDSHAALTVSGLPSCTAVIDQNEQLAGRFLAPVSMPRFDWTTSEHREEFMGILGAFHQSLERHFSTPNLSSEEMAFRFYCATGGLMGYLTKLLRQAVWDVLDAGKSVILLEDFASSHNRALWHQHFALQIQNPFTKEFSALPTPDLMSKVKHIGTRPDMPLPTRKTSSKKQNLNVNQVLTTK